MSTLMNAEATCSACGFTTRDIGLLAGHSCDVTENGGRCEDFPCCGHEAGDCNGLLYGSDEYIKERALSRWDNPDIDPMDPYYDEMGW